MADIPAPLTYGTVIGRFISILADSSDTGNAPDVVPLTGTVTIAPLMRTFRITSGTPQIAIASNIEARVVAGQLLGPDGVTPLRILASDTPGITPSPLQYSAQFALNDVSAQPGTIIFTVPSGGTVDLGTLVSIPAVAPVQTVVSDASRIAAEAAAERAEYWANISQGGGGGGGSGPVLWNTDTDGVPYFTPNP